MSVYSVYSIYVFLEEIPLKPANRLEFQLFRNRKTKALFKNICIFKIVHTKIEIYVLKNVSKKSRKSKDSHYFFWLEHFIFSTYINK